MSPQRSKPSSDKERGNWVMLEGFGGAGACEARSGGDLAGEYRLRVCNRSFPGQLVQILQLAS